MSSTTVWIDGVEYALYDQNTTADEVVFAPFDCNTCRRTKCKGINGVKWH